MQRASSAGWVVLVCVGALGWACTRLDPSHCGNRSGHETCRARPDARPYCDLCTSVDDGCVEELAADAMCRPGADADGTGTDADGTGTDADGTGTVAGMTTEAETSEPVSTGSTGTEPETETGIETGVEPETETDGEPMCGNGVREGDEACDGDDFGGETCASVMGSGHYQGTLACSGECEFVTHGCCLGPGAPCTPVVDDEDCCARVCVMDGLEGECGVP